MAWVLRKKISNLTKILRAHENVVFGNVCLTKKSLLQCGRTSKFWGLVVKLYMFIVVETNFWYVVWNLRKKILNFDKVDSWKKHFLQNWHYLFDRKSILVMLDKLQTQHNVGLNEVLFASTNWFLIVIWFFRKLTPNLDENDFLIKFF